MGHAMKRCGVFLCPDKLASNGALCRQHWFAVQPRLRGAVKRAQAFYAETIKTGQTPDFGPARRARDELEAQAIDAASAAEKKHAPPLPG